MRQKMPTGKNQKLLVPLLKEKLGNGTKLSFDQLQENAKNILTNVPETHRSGRARETLKSLIELGFLIEDEGFIYLS